MALPINFISDYGRDDDFVGVCHAVIARLAPEARVIDITHGIPRHGVRAAALILANTLPYTPPGVHLTVVDPGVGSHRRAVAVRVAEEGRLLVGPDNGVLGLAIGRCGGAVEAVGIDGSPFRLEPVSPTFHGRDIFAPVAARLAAGATLAEAGEPLALDSLTSLTLSQPVIEQDRVRAHAIYVDRFGNVALDLRPEDIEAGPLRLGEPIAVEAGEGRHGGTFARTFADVGPGEVLLYEDSYRTLALAVNRGHAAETLGLSPGDPVVLATARE